MIESGRIVMEPREIPEELIEDWETMWNETVVDGAYESKQAYFEEQARDWLWDHFLIEQGDNSLHLEVDRIELSHE